MMLLMSEEPDHEVCGVGHGMGPRLTEDGWPCPPGGGQTGALLHAVTVDGATGALVPPNGVPSSSRLSPAPSDTLGEPGAR